MRVASLPAAHVYVRHLSPPAADDDDGVVRLPVPGAEPGQWALPEESVTDWLTAHAGSYDLVHVHHGLVDLPAPEELVACLQALGRPLVLTVHDLPFPDHPDGERCSADLDVLVPAADEVLTLTIGAARQVLAGWGRTSHVLPHPHVVPEERLALPRRQHTGFVIGLHAGDLAGADPSELIDEVLRHLAGSGATLRVDVDTVVMEADDGSLPVPFVRHVWDLASRGSIDLRAHSGLTTADLVGYVDTLDACVVWDHRAHSAWVEACYDLGVRALVPTRGFQAAQRPCLPIPTYRPDGVRVALLAALRRPAPPRPSAVQRLDERRFVALAHRELYASLLGAPRRGRPLAGSARSAVEEA